MNLAYFVSLLAIVIGFNFKILNQYKIGIIILLDGMCVFSYEMQMNINTRLLFHRE